VTYREHAPGGLTLTEAGVYFHFVNTNASNAGGTRRAKKTVAGVAAVSRLIMMAAVSALCAGQSFTTELLYQAESFAGDSLGGRVVRAAFFMTASGADSTIVPGGRRQMRRIRRMRRDLAFVFTGVSAAGAPLLTGDEVGDFVAGDVLAVQTNDSLWSRVPEPYLLVITMRNAAKITDFDRNSERHVRLETELWDARRAEVVWRAGISGTGPSHAGQDRDFLRAAAAEAFRALPRPSPSAHHQDNW